MLKKIGAPFIGFVFLNLYFNVPLKLFSSNNLIQFIALISMFPVMYLVAKWTKLDGLRGIGVYFHKGWFKNLLISLGIGFGFWLLMHSLLIALGVFSITGIKSFSTNAMILLFITVGYGLGSIINDMMICGYVIGHLKGKISIKWVFLISIFLYCIDDVWHGGFTVINMIFSFSLGLSLTYAFYKTGSIWANTGIHWGLNICYGLFYGLSGSEKDGIFFIRLGHKNPFVEHIFLISIPLIMFLVIYILITKTNLYTKKTSN